jgi:hypothetical protein
MCVTFHASGMLSRLWLTDFASNSSCAGSTMIMFSIFDGLKSELPSLFLLSSTLSTSRVCVSVANSEPPRFDYNRFNCSVYV